MKLDNYLPIFRQVLFKEVREEKTNKGIFIPGRDFKLTSGSDFFETEKIVYDGSKSNLGVYVVVKAAEDCTVVAVGQKLVLSPYAQVLPVPLDEGSYFSVAEHHIFGVETS